MPRPSQPRLNRLCPPLIPRLHPIQLVIPPEIERQFARQARAAFPRETLAYLLGYDLGARLEVTRLWVPGPDLMQATLNSVSLEDHTDWVAVQAALDGDSDLRVLGDVHTHPFRRKDYLHVQAAHLSPSRAPSDIDWDHRWGLRWISGICLVIEGPSGLLRTGFRWWGPMAQVEVILPSR